MRALLDMVASAANQLRAPALAGPGEALGLAEAEEIILRRRYGVVFRPVLATRLSTQGGEVLGWRPAARFRGRDGRDVSAGELFRILHGHPPMLFHAEMELKRHVLAHAPAGQRLFLRLDADAYSAGGESPGNVFHPLLKDRQAESIVVEVVENRVVLDLRRLTRLLCDLATHGLPVAAAGIPMARALPPELLGSLDWIVLSRQDLNQLHMARKVAEVRRIIEAVQAGGGGTLLAGVRHQADLDLAREMGFTAVSGPCLDRLGHQVWEEGYVEARAHVD